MGSIHDKAIPTDTTERSSSVDAVRRSESARRILSTAALVNVFADAVGSQVESTVALAGCTTDCVGAVSVHTERLVLTFIHIGT